MTNLIKNFFGEDGWNCGNRCDYSVLVNALIFRDASIKLLRYHEGVGGDDTIDQGCETAGVSERQSDETDDAIDGERM